MNQTINNQLNPDEIAATLAFVTNMSEGLMPQNIQGQSQLQSQEQTISPSQNGSQTPELALGQEQNAQQAIDSSKEENNAKFADLEGKMEKMKTEIESMVKDEISSVKDIIINALKDGQE